jgi:hypothetical protein
MMKKFEVTFYYIDGNIDAETVNNTLLTLLPCEANTKYKVRTLEINKSVYDSINSECDILREFLLEQLKQNEELVSLVKKMREAQAKIFEFYVDDGWWADRAIELEKEVDEYLKKMEI